MKPLGQFDSVWRLIGRSWNLRVRYPLSLLKADFVGRFFATVRWLIVMQGKQRLKLIDMGSATPSPSLATMLERDDDKPTSWTKSMVAGSIPVRLPHFNIRRKK